jgi:hypothetical protein
MKSSKKHVSSATGMPTTCLHFLAVDIAYSIPPTLEHHFLRTRLEPTLRAPEAQKQLSEWLTANA